MPNGRNIPLDPRDVGPGYTGPLRFNDMVLTPEQEERLRIKGDQEKGSYTVQPSPEFEAIPLLNHSQVTGEAPATSARTSGQADPPPNLPLIKTEPPEVEPDKTEYYDWEMIPKRNSDVDKTGITFKRRSEEYITAHKKYLN